MTNNSQKSMRGVMTEVLQDVLPKMFSEQEQRLEEKFDQKLDDLKMNLRDEIHSTVKASEAGLIRRMDELEGKLTTRMDEGFSTVLDTLDREVFPQLNRHEQEILALQLHVKTG